MILRGLASEGKRLLTPELVSGAVDRWSEPEYGEFLVELERRFTLDAFDEAIDRALQSTARFDPGIDAALAPALHRALPLSRRQAADPAVWRYLTVIHRPDFVRHRWENKSWASMRSRFWSLGTRPDSNVFARLFWIAELTCERQDYSLTEAVLARQQLATAVFVRNLGSYRPAVQACVQELDASSGQQVEATIKLLNKALGTLVLESLSAQDLVALIRDLREQCA
jgi:hypothetical protein